MDTMKMKNMVVLKNLPSNIVDEAFVILKSSKKAKKLEKIENNKQQKTENETKKDQDYILKEADMLISDYISRIENKDCLNKENPKKYKRWAYISTAIVIIETIILISS